MSTPFPGYSSQQRPDPQPNGWSVPPQQAWPAPPPAIIYQQQHVVARNPALYALASVLVAGLGTALCGRVGTALLIFATVVFSAMLMAIPFIGLLFIPLWLAAWFFSAYHGFKSAKEWNARHGIIS